jgi:hypothetical protein
MKIRFSQSGGLTGLIQSFEIDTKALSRSETAEIESLVETSGILTAKIPYWRKLVNRQLVACDLFFYSISIESGKAANQLKFDDSTIPEGSRPLLNYLKNRARPVPQG